MYIQYCSSKQNGKTYTYPLLCKKYRESGKIKTEVIANLTRFPKEVIMAIEGALKNKQDVLVSLKDIVFKSSIDYGFVFVRVTLIFWGLSKKFMKSKEKKLSINNPSLISPE